MKFDNGYIWNPRNCACECDKLCDIGQYLDYKNWLKNVLMLLMEIFYIMKH